MRNSTIFNMIPRNCGKLMTHMAKKLIDARPLFIFVAMFDEVNEGTAIFKAASTFAPVLPLLVQFHPFTQKPNSSATTRLP